MIGRQREQEILHRVAESTESEFVAVYGRRRVGKTYLVRETFDGEFTFMHSGMARVGLMRQLQAFRSSLREWGHESCPRLTNWIDAFDELKALIKASSNGRKIVFIDEMPWMDTPKSGFVPALENFWNGWASARKDVVLIVCGSATSWIVSKVLKNRGGLHDRVTEEVALRPFTLRECELYAESRGLELTRRQIAECYMVLGGVPYYWRMLPRGVSPAQAVDALIFSETGRLRSEFDELYSSLFRRKEPYVRIVEALAATPSGLKRDELAAATASANSGRLTQHLAELEQCGFIRRYHALGCKTKESIYQLMDNYTIFHLRMVASGKLQGAHPWVDAVGTSAHSAWAGLAFERLCLQHVDALKRSLQIGGVSTNEQAWRGASSDGKAVQIDLLLDRRDGIVDLCEMKYTQEPFAMDESEWRAISRRRDALRRAAGPSRAVHVVLVAAAGVVRNAWLNEVQHVVRLDDLFTD